MICARCISPIDAGSEACPACGERPHLLGRYRLDRALELIEPDSLGFRATRVEDAMLTRVCAVELDAALDPASAARLAETISQTGHNKIARVLEVWLDPAHARLWTVHERVAGTALTLLAREIDPRIHDQRWVLALARELAEVLVALHNNQPALFGVDLSLDAFVLRHGVGGRRRSGPPRSSLVELRVRPGPAAPSPRDDVRRLGLTLISLVEEAAPSPGPSWRAHQGLDPLLVELIEQMIDPGGYPQLGAAAVRRELDVIENKRRNAEALAAQASPLAHRPKPAAARLRPSTPGPPPLSRESVRGARPTPRDDVPVMRPEDLSRELSQAHRATAIEAYEAQTALETIEARQRKQHGTARVLVVVLAAAIAALMTYIFVVSR